MGFCQTGCWCKWHLKRVKFRKSDSSWFIYFQVCANFNFTGLKFYQQAEFKSWFSWDLSLGNRVNFNLTNHSWHLNLFWKIKKMQRGSLLSIGLNFLFLLELGGPWFESLLYGKFQKSILAVYFLISFFLKLSSFLPSNVGEVMFSSRQKEDKIWRWIYKVGKWCHCFLQFFIILSNSL